MKPRLFIGSSAENLDIANTIQELLEDETDPVVWNQGIFGLSRYPLEELLSELEKSDFAIFVFTPDDLTKIRQKQFRTVRDNVIFELGLFVGRLGRDRTFIVQPSGSDNLHLPTDLLGLMSAPYNPDRPDRNLLAALRSACTKILRAIKSANIEALYSTNDYFLRTFFQGNLYVVHETILIVVGTSIGAERYDRVLAQLLKKILHNANIEAEIITDIFYQEKIKEFNSNPLICIGSRGTNKLVNKYEKKFKLKDRETTVKIFIDNQRPLAFIYGGGVKETHEATIDFCKNKLIVFVDKWSSLYTKGKKIAKIPLNIEDSLKEIIFTMSNFGDN